MNKDLSHLVGNKLSPAIMDITTVLEALDKHNINLPVREPLPGESEPVHTMSECLEHAKTCIRAFIKECYALPQ
jgi:hypothetical protein